MPSTDDRPPSPAPSEFLPAYITELGHGPSLDGPPNYVPPRPLQPLTYTFTSFESESGPGFGVTHLMPPHTSADLAPAYNITVKLDLNPFAPLSYITTIKRGGTARGDFVGSFEICMNEKKAFVTMGRKTKRLTNALWSIHGSKRHWDWSFSDTNLRWDCRSTLDDGSPLCVCYDAPTSHQVAIFIPPPLDASPPIPAAALTVFPDGWGAFDEILLSALVLERKRSLEP